MPSALLLPLITCSVVLLVSGGAKLRDPAAVDSAFLSMRVPSPLDAAWARRTLPWAELALGLWLLVATGAALVLVGFLVLVLFLVYLGLVARALRLPAPADCGCFGAIGESRVTAVTLWRNALLALTAGLTVVAGFRDVSVLADVRAEGVWAWLVAALLTVAVAVLVTWRPGGRDVTGDAPPEVGDDGEYTRVPIPHAQVATEGGRALLLSQEVRRGAHLLVFLSPGCGPCQSIGEDLAVWQERLAPVVVRAVVTASPRVVRRRPYLAGHWFDEFGVTRDAFGVSTPGAVLLGADGLLAGGPVRGEDEVRAFVAEVTEHLREARDDPAAGQEDVTGELESVSDDR
jgi:hypothetical protein